jgi:hypothetical protein
MSGTNNPAMGIVDFDFNLSDKRLYFVLALSTVSNTSFTASISAVNPSYFLGPMRISYIKVDATNQNTFSVSYLNIVIN